MALTYVAIATVTVGSGGAANMEFTSIPATYTDLLVKICARSTQGNLENFKIQFNGNTTGADYSYMLLYGTGSSAQSSSANNQWVTGVIPGTDYTASTFGNTELYIPNYAGSNNKSYSADSVTENNATASYALLGAQIWKKTDAITSILIASTQGNLAQYSTATLYGIKNTV